jgi:hypothetical protein
MISDQPKETPYFTVVTFVILGLGILINYLIPTSGGWEGLGEFLLRALCLSGVVLPLSILSLFRREDGAPLVIPILAIAFCFWE